MWRETDQLVALNEEFAGTVCKTMKYTRRWAAGAAPEPTGPTHRCVFCGTEWIGFHKVELTCTNCGGKVERT